MRSSKARSRNKVEPQSFDGQHCQSGVRQLGTRGQGARDTAADHREVQPACARCAALGNDRVAFENFQQHAEHYTRLAGRGACASRTSASRAAGAGTRRNVVRTSNSNNNNDRNENRHDNRSAQPAAWIGARKSSQTCVRGSRGSDQRDRYGSPMTAATAGLVETPESKPAKRRRQRGPRKDQAAMAAPKVRARHHATETRHGRGGRRRPKSADDGRPNQAEAVGVDRGDWP